MLALNSKAVKVLSRNSMTTSQITSKKFAKILTKIIQILALPLQHTLLILITKIYAIFAVALAANVPLPRKAQLRLMWRDFVWASNFLMFVEFNWTCVAPNTMQRRRKCSVMGTTSTQLKTKTLGYFIHSQRLLSLHNLDYWTWHKHYNAL